MDQALDEPVLGPAQVRGIHFFSSYSLSTLPFFLTYAFYSLYIYTHTL